MLPCVWSVHHDPKYFDDPDTFKPERWIDPMGNLIKKDYSIGFGAGKMFGF